MSEPTSSEAARRNKVLVVDDAPENLQVLVQTLRGSYVVVAANSGEEALKMALVKPQPDIILLDIIMPGIDGYTVCRRLKDDIRTHNIPVIFVTALDHDEDEVHGFELGAVDYIRKPIKPALVSARVRTHLELKRHQNQLEEIVAEQVVEIMNSNFQTIFALSKLAESRDDDTGKHVDRTQRYCKILAQDLLDRGKHEDKIDREFVETIFHSSPLHDIGKVAIPDNVLCKPGKLTDEEFDIMKTHAARGAETLSHVANAFPKNKFINMGREIAESHHEKWDGSGYPYGKKEDKSPACGRIMAVADVYDALTSKRCYKEAFSHEKSRDIIVESRGSHFDPSVVEAFVNREAEFNRLREKMQV